jgi:hypothetical protein
MVEADFSGNYVNADNTKENDVLEIIEKPYKESKLDVDTKASYEVTNMKVRLPNGTVKVYSPWRETGVAFTKVWGKEMDNWVGHKFTAKLVNYSSFGTVKQRIDGVPLL